MSTPALVLSDNSSCKKVVIDFTHGAINIRLPVGQLNGHGGNLDPDVRTVQTTLNSISVQRGGCNGGTLLKVDGVCGDKTKTAILKYQTKNFGGGDSRVDPDGRTARQMDLDLHPFDAPDEELVKIILSLVPQARIIIKGAQVKLGLAEPAFQGISGGIMDGVQSDAMALVNKHFSLDKFPDWTPEFYRIRHVFDSMELVIARGYNNPLAQWQGVFMPNTSKQMENDAQAYTYAGGARKVGVSTDILPFAQRFDRIYICRKLAQKCSEYQAMAIVHELSHFVGGDYSSPNMIDDHAYGWIDSPKMSGLYPWWRTRNAQSFANFAFDATFGYRPPGL